MYGVQVKGKVMGRNLDKLSVLAIHNERPLDQIFNGVINTRTRAIITQEFTFPKKGKEKSYIVTPTDKEWKTEKYIVIAKHIKEVHGEEHLRLLDDLLELGISVGIIATTKVEDMPKEEDFDMTQKYPRDLYEIAYQNYEYELKVGLGSVRRKLFHLETVIAFRTNQIRFISSLKHYGCSYLGELLSLKRYIHTKFMNPNVILDNEERLFHESDALGKKYWDHYSLRHQWVRRTRDRFKRILERNALWEKTNRLDG